MDQKRLLIAIAVSIAILLGFQYLMPRARHPAPLQPVAESTATQPANPDAPRQPGTAPGAAVAGMLAKDAPRLPITAARVSGSLSLRGAMLDDLVLRDYHEELSDTSPLVRVLAPQYDPEPNYIQFGWTSATPGVKLPDETTDWTASAKALTQAAPVTLSWNNGAGLTFSIKLSIDDNYMFTAVQSVHNATGAPVVLTPFSRVRRDYQAAASGYYILHEGPVGVLDGTLKDPSYATIKSDGEKHDGIGASYSSDGGWAGITDKYWLTALVPDQASKQIGSFRYGTTPGGAPRYEADFSNADAQTVAPGADAAFTVRAFAGAKEVHLLDRYERDDNIPHFDKAVDFGMFYFLTKPIFFALDWLYGLLGNFGLAIMVFTVFAKALFFPLANKSYRSMSKMKLLGPKMTALRERYKEEPAKLQSEMMALYKSEKVNPASGCLPMVVQIPVFFSLYKVIFVTIEMRHAPFFGWVHDLSALDPTNLFNLFGLLPFDPIAIAPALHLSAWTLIMGFTMFMQQQLNPPPPDPMQARLFKFMPLIFMFMMGRFPAGLLIYWSWNNTLTIAQQWLIMRRAKLSPDFDASARAEREEQELIEAGRLLFAAPARFVFATQRLEQLPPPMGHEVAFAGRSNVGKSSLINALVGHHALARASNTPGRTRQLNFFDLGGRLTLVDMPGYGYAQAAKSVKEDWQGLMFEYLRGRPTLRRVLLLMDARIEVKESDSTVMDLLDRAAVTYQFVLTKADDVKPRALAAKQAELAAIARQHAAAHPEVMTTSSNSGLGIDRLRGSLAALTD